MTMLSLMARGTPCRDRWACRMIESVGACPRAIGRDVLKGLQRRLRPLDARQCRVNDRTHARAAHPPITFGTRKSPASRLASGALASASSVGNDGRG